MMELTLVTALLCTFSWISVSVSEFHTVEAQPGEEVTLKCSNFSSLPSHIFWFKLDDRSNASCISSMLTSDDKASSCDEHQNGKFNMWSNTTTLFLCITQVNSSDSGLYFCGPKSEGRPAIVSATHLKVEERTDGIRELTSAILGALLIFFFVVIFGLVVKVRKLQTAHKEGLAPQRSENPGNDALNYAALNFQPRTKPNRGHAAERETESDVVYASTTKKAQQTS